MSAAKTAGGEACGACFVRDSKGNSGTRSPERGEFPGPSGATTVGEERALGRIPPSSPKNKTGPLSEPALSAAGYFTLFPRARIGNEFGPPCPTRIARAVHRAAAILDPRRGVARDRLVRTKELLEKFEHRVIPLFVRHDSHFGHYRHAHTTAAQCLTQLHHLVYHPHEERQNDRPKECAPK